MRCASPVAAQGAALYQPDGLEPEVRLMSQTLPHLYRATMLAISFTSMRARRSNSSSFSSLAFFSSASEAPTTALRWEWCPWRVRMGA